MAHITTCYKIKKNQKGFTMIEILWILGITSIILGFVTINLISSSQKASVSSYVSTLITDIRQQQLRAMMGDGGVSSIPSNYGIYFQNNSYILFKGASYVPGNSENLVVTLPSTLRFTTPSATFIFSQTSGQLPIASSQAILDTTNGRSEEIQINKYGVVTKRISK